MFERIYSTTTHHKLWNRLFILVHILAVMLLNSGGPKRSKLMSRSLVGKQSTLLVSKLRKWIWRIHVLYQRQDLDKRGAIRMECLKLTAYGTRFGLHRFASIGLLESIKVQFAWEKSATCWGLEEASSGIVCFCFVCQWGGRSL